MENVYKLNRYFHMDSNQNIKTIVLYLTVKKMLLSIIKI